MGPRLRERGRVNVPGPPASPGWPLTKTSFQATVEKLAKKSEGKPSVGGLQDAERLTTTRAVPTQAETLAWVRERWPDRCSPLHRVAKLCEEAGETIGAVIKMEDGSGRKTEADVAQETAQTVICAMALAESVGFDLWAEVAAEYARCQVRVWAPIDGSMA